jgi:hypothetical protein
MNIHKRIDTPQVTSATDLSRIPDVTSFNSQPGIDYFKSQSYSVPSGNILNKHGCFSYIFVRSSVIL